MRIPKRKAWSAASSTKVITLELYRAVCKVECVAGRASCISCHQRRFKLLAILSHYVLHVQTLSMVAQGILINDLAGGVNLSIYELVPLPMYAVLPEGVLVSLKTP